MFTCWSTANTRTNTTEWDTRTNKTWHKLKSWIRQIYLPDYGGILTKADKLLWRKSQSIKYKFKRTIQFHSIFWNTKPRLCHQASLVLCSDAFAQIGCQRSVTCWIIPHVKPDRQKYFFFFPFWEAYVQSKNRYTRGRIGCQDVDQSKREYYASWLELLETVRTQ